MIIIIIFYDLNNMPPMQISNEIENTVGKRARNYLLQAALSKVKRIKK
jgi:hypothetical protein